MDIFVEKERESDRERQRDSALSVYFAACLCFEDTYPFVFRVGEEVLLLPEEHGAFIVRWASRPHTNHCAMSTPTAIEATLPLGFAKKNVQSFSYSVDLASSFHRTWGKFWMQGKTKDGRVGFALGGSRLYPID